ncbi:hypothetical protein AB3X96_37935 [Paraburkholderia sp. BR13439]|uniref:hypothetical protein n=1 Tax=unclassified Paraburkholderia TaxID=2615204 RepID=UPI0034D01178
MAIRIINMRPSKHARLPAAGYIDLSLRNHLCFSALRDEYGCAFHLGTIVRTLFVSFYLFDAGYGDGNLADYSEADLRLSELAMSRNLQASYRLSAHAVEPTARLLTLFDTQLQAAPLNELIEAHRRADRNINAPPEERLSIDELVQRSRRRVKMNRDRPATNFPRTQG